MASARPEAFLPWFRGLTLVSGTEGEESRLKMKFHGVSSHVADVP